MTKASLSGLIIYTLNPKRRFMYPALLISSYSGYSAVPLLTGKIGLKKEFLDGNFSFLFKIGEPVNLIVSLLLIILSAYLFWLDSKQK